MASNEDSTTSNTSLNTPSITASDPYFVHPSDNPTSVLVQPLLHGDNYCSWERSMTKALSAKAKLGFVNGVLIAPASSDEKHAHWKRADDLVSSWICHSTIPAIKASIDYLPSSLMVWSDLKERFAQTSAPKLYQLKQSISNLKQTNQTLSAHYTALRALWDEIDSIRPLPTCICGASKQTLDLIDQDRAMEFLQSLDDRFSSLRSNILQRDVFPSVRTIHNLVRQEEVQQEMHQHSSPAVDAAALQVGYSDHRVASSSDSNKKSKYYCEHCKIHGHSKSHCFKIIGYPPRKPSSRERSVAAISAPNSAVVNQASHDSLMPGFTADQYRGLLTLLNQNGAAQNQHGGAFNNNGGAQNQHGGAFNNNGGASSQSGDGQINPSVNLTGPFNDDSDW